MKIRIPIKSTPDFPAIPGSSESRKSAGSLTVRREGRPERYTRCGADWAECGELGASAGRSRPVPRRGEGRGRTTFSLPVEQVPPSPPPPTSRLTAKEPGGLDSDWIAGRRDGRSGDPGPGAREAPWDRGFGPTGIRPRNGFLSGSNGSPGSFRDV